MSTLPDLLTILQARTGFEPVQQSQENDRIYLYGRIRGQTIANMLVFVGQLVFAAVTAPWNADVSQAYSWKGGHLAKGWRFVITSDDIPRAINHIVSMLKNMPAAKSLQVEEFPLSGYAASREGQGTNGKGASESGKAVIGRR